MPDNVDIHVHIASDGDDPDYVNTLCMVAGQYGKPFTVSNSGGKGYGANYNLAMQTVHMTLGVQWILPLEDDWELVRPLNVEPLLELLSRDDYQDKIEPADMNPTPYLIGCVRMGYIGYTQALSSTFIKYKGSHYLLFDHESAEPHVFAGHPRIETVKWERELGPWPEGLAPGRTEWEVAHRSRSREGIVWPIDLIKPCGDAFVHIGTDRSY